MYDYGYSVLPDKVAEFLTRKGVVYKEVRRPSGTFYLARCPICNEPDFAINKYTGSFNCFHLKKCGIKGSFKKLRELLGGDIMQVMVEPQKKKPIEKKVENPDLEVGEFLKSRGFKPEIYRQFKDILGKEGKAIAFIYKYKGETYGIKYRDVNEKRFWKEKGSAPLLYNMDACEGQEDLFIVEGELDVIAAKHYGIDAVSIPNGAQDQSWIEYNWEYLSQFKHIIFMLDNDEAGQLNIKKMSRRLGYARCLNVKLPYKDINECLMKNVTIDEISRCIVEAEEFGGEHIRRCADYIQKIDSIINDKTKSVGVETPFVGLTQILRGWRAGEVTVWTGINGSGKSTVLLQVALDLCKKGERVLVGSFEIPPERYLKWVVQMEVGETNVDLEYKKILSELNGRLFCIDKVGSIKTTDLYDTIEYAARRYDIKHIVVDSLMRIRYKTSDMYKEQADFIVNLCRLAQEHELHIHLVAHPRKGDSDLDEPDKVDIAGSSDITNNAHNVVVVLRPEGNTKLLKRHKITGICDTLLIVKKNREYGKHGAVPLMFEENKKYFHDA